MEVKHSLHVTRVLGEGDMAREEIIRRAQRSINHHLQHLRLLETKVQSGHQQSVLVGDRVPFTDLLICHAASSDR